MIDTAESQRGELAAPVLAAWLAAHGPLGGGAALILARQIFVDASALDAGRLARSTASLTSANIVRQPNGEWRWSAVASSSLYHHPTDNEIAGRVGAIVFECLTATPLSDYLPAADAVIARLREHRADLPPSVVQLVARLAAARSLARAPLEDWAADVQRELGVTARDSRASVIRRRGVAGGVFLGLLALWSAARSGDGNTVETHGLTRHEMVVHDLATESADLFALADEHTMALDRLKELERLWRERVPADDARVTLNYLRQAWVRTLAQDFLTAEQILPVGPGLLGPALGNDHPYVRAARLHLAVAFDRRHAAEPAREQRAAAHASANRLLPAAVADSLEDAAGPPMPGVLAHVEPNGPEQEGFRRDRAGGYTTPLTSGALWLAGQYGWRLHVGATTPCRAAVDAGSAPRHLEVRLRRDGDAWRVAVDGVQPPVEFDLAGSPIGRVSVTVDVAPSGEVSVLSGGESRRVSVDRDAWSNPPYALTFVGAQGDKGCALVWWEVKPAG